MIVELRREGRAVKNIATGKEEKALTTFINGRKIMRGHCDKYFQRVTGIKMPVNGRVKLQINVISHEHIRDEKCPKCGKVLIINDAGASWCSDEENCDYRDKGY